MMVKVKMACSAIAVVAWCILIYQRSALISSGECDSGTLCDLEATIFISLVGLYISLELLIAPESTALYLLSKTLSRGRSSPGEGRIGGLLGVIFWSLILYGSVLPLFGTHP